MKLTSSGDKTEWMSCHIVYMVEVMVLQALPVEAVVVVITFRGVALRSCHSRVLCDCAFLMRYVSDNLMT